MSNVFKAHAERLYSTFDIEEKKRDEMDDKILDFIKSKPLPLSIRDILQTVKLKGRRPHKEDVLRAIKGAYKMEGSKIVKKI